MKTSGDCITYYLSFAFDLSNALLNVKQSSVKYSAKSFSAFLNDFAQLMTNLAKLRVQN